MTVSKQFIDLSHTIEHGLITYKGLPAPVICDFLSREQSRQHYAPGTEFQIGKIEMVANTGTYLDSPFHRYEKGKDLSQLELASLADLDGVVIRRRRYERAIADGRIRWHRSERTKQCSFERAGMRTGRRTVILKGILF